MEGRLTELARGEVGGSAEDALETSGELVGHWWSEFLPGEVVLVLRFRFGKKTKRKWSIFVAKRRLIVAKQSFRFD